jgi:hypothetical protein
MSLRLSRRFIQLGMLVLFLASLSLVLTGYAVGTDFKSVPDGVPPLHEIDAWERWLNLAERVGFCLVGFAILAYLLYRQDKLEGVTKRYDEMQAAHLQAFKDINAVYRSLSDENQNVILLNTQIQTRLVEKLERMERDHGQGRLL